MLQYGSRRIKASIGEMGMSKKKISVLHLVLLILMVVIFVFVGAAEEAEKSAYCSGEVVQLSDGWVLSGGKEICVPVQLVHYLPQSVEIMRQLGEVDRADSLVICSRHTVLEVYIEEEKIYEFGENLKFFQIPVTNWNVIPMKEEYGGKQVRVVHTAKSDSYRGDIGTIYLGDKTAIFVHIIRENLAALFCASLIFGISFMVVVLWVVAKKRQIFNQVLYLALFGISVALWEILNARIPQLFWGKAEFFSLATFEILLFMPIPFILFYSEFSWEENRGVEWVSLIPSVNFLFCNLLQFLGLMDVSQTVGFSHFVIISVVIILCYMNIRFRKKRKGEKRINIETVGFCLLSAAVIADVLQYRFRWGKVGISYIGLLIYVFCFVLYISRGIFFNMMKGKKAELYEELAYHDKMTGLWNRTAYQEYLNELLDLGVEQTVGYGAFAFDLNNLKKINDRYGHDRGDQYIRDNADYLSREMEDIGRVYRTGGDEFVCIFNPSMQEKARKCAERMEELVVKGRDARINFSFGFAICELDKDKSFEDTIRRADVAMYAYKRQHKAERVE